MDSGNALSDGWVHCLLLFVVVSGMCETTCMSFQPYKEAGAVKLPHCHSPTKMSVIDLKLGGWLVGWFIRAGQSLLFVLWVGHASSRPSSDTQGFCLSQLCQQSKVSA